MFMRFPWALEPLGRLNTPACAESLRVPGRVPGAAGEAPRKWRQKAVDVRVCARLACGHGPLSNGPNGKKKLGRRAADKSLASCFACASRTGGRRPGGCAENGDSGDTPAAPTPLRHLPRRPHSRPRVRPAPPHHAARFRVECTHARTHALIQGTRKHTSHSGTRAHTHTTQRTCSHTSRTRTQRHLRAPHRLSTRPGRPSRPAPRKGKPPSSRRGRSRDRARGQQG